MAKLNLKNVGIPAVVLTIICLVISAALAFTNDITKDRIAENEESKSIKAMSEIFKDADFEKNTLKYNGEECEYYIASLNSKACGYIFTTSGAGYGGEVKVMTGVNADGTVKAIKVLSVDDETPGLGQSAAKDEFQNQFAGKSGKISTEKNKDIDALTGATITTNAVIGDVNQALEMYEIVKGGTK